MVYKQSFQVKISYKLMSQLTVSGRRMASWEKKGTATCVCMIILYRKFVCINILKQVLMIRVKGKKQSNCYLLKQLYKIGT